tara:strand:+ start:1092 stop:1949 length:858 start_codon:yes stop_codon:yes gene_type:complete
MKVMDVSEDIAKIIYQYYLTYERRKNLMKPMKTYDLKCHFNILWKHRKLDCKTPLINAYMIEGLAYGGDPDFISMYHNEWGFNYSLEKHIFSKKTLTKYTPSRTILQLQKTYNIDYEKRENYCLMCMGDLYEDEENYCENPNCFFGEGGCSKLCNDCVIYDEHSYCDDAMNYNRNYLKISWCGNGKCEDYLDDKLEIIENGLVCSRCEFVLLPQCFNDYPGDNHLDGIYQKFCDDCYVNLQEECERYWEMLKEAVFIEKVHKRIKDFWKGYVYFDINDDEFQWSD